MDYKLVDLGMRTLRNATAYIVTPTESLMVTGGQEKVCSYLNQMAANGKHFFGNLCFLKRKNVVSFGFAVHRVRKNRRFVYEFSDNSNDVWLTVRRLPKKWPVQLSNLKEQLLVASDACEEKGLLAVANMLRTKAAANLQVRSLYFE